MNANIERHAEHMAAVRAIHRRSYYERVCLKIAEFMGWERLAKASEGPAFSDREAEQLAALIEIREELREEMRAAGQEP